MLLSCSNICKQFGENILFQNLSFTLDDSERVALVGANGTGKTTLIKIITGEYLADSGEAVLQKTATLGYLPQEPNIESDKTIYDELICVRKDILDMENVLRDLEEQMNTTEDSDLEKLIERYHNVQEEFEKLDGYAYRSHVQGIINGLGFDKESNTTPISALSGGQKTRVALGKLLLLQPDLLILDEPTNHLDLDSIQWLENYLLGYKGGILLVSHDRFFLDKVVSKVVEIDSKKCRTYTGNYTDYAKKHQEILHSMIKSYENYQREVEHQKKVIEKLRQFNREKSIKRAESREKMLDKMEVVERIDDSVNTINFKLTPAKISGNDVLHVEDFSKSFDDVRLFSQVNFDIRRGEKVAIIGKNGTGKTTLLKILSQQILPDEGYAKFGANVEIGYYDQEHNTLSDHKSIFDEIHDAFPDLDNSKIRNVLASFLFTGDDVFKTIDQLSGGEKGRVSLAKLMLSSANFLLLDEPTNHLDIDSKEILENVLKEYEGTLLFVSHDRYFVDKVATRILDLTENRILNYDGNYSYYLAKKDVVENRYLGDTKGSETKKVSAAKLDWAEQKERDSKLRKLENSYKKVEKEIEKLEAEIEKIDEELALPENAYNSAKLNELSEKRSSLENSLETAMEEWEESAEKIEVFKAEYGL
ncbi:MAG: ABC-F family ATP-binding cassette domain-containing protein [Eubacterium sp.]|nr:ABC-F family ATP-binding cassette domain-containing protein [Eubacterium sp.]